MNFGKKTLFWVIVLILLCGAYYFSEQKAEDNRRAEAARLRLFSINLEEVNEFWINNIKADLRLRAARGQEGWQLIQPLIAKADEDAINKLLKNVITARKDAVLFTKAEPEKLKELGLDVPDIEMGIKIGDKETVIIFGDSGPTHNVAYAMFKGNPNVFRIHADVREEAKKDVHALRDKTVLDFEPLKMRRFEAERKGKDRVVIEHDKGKWNILEPTQGRASMEKVVESLFEIKNAQIKVFNSDNPTDLAPYGLVTPMLKLTIFQEDKEAPYAPYILTIGDKDRKNRGYFAMTNQAKNVFTVEEDMVNAILLNMDNWAE